MKNTNNISAFYQTYKNRKCVEFVLENYFKNNPDSTLTLISDNGLDYSDISSKYNCFYIHSFVNLGRQGHQKSKIESDYKVDRWEAFNKEETFIWLNRFYESCKNSIKNGSEYIIMLEDDVYITNKIEINPEWDFAGGCNSGNIINQKLLDYMKEKYNSTPNVEYYSCCGGAIFNARIFVENYYKIIKFIDDEFENLKKLDNRIGWLDFYMQIIYYFLGCKYSVNPQFTETWMDNNWNSEKYSIVHQYKNLY